MGVPDNERERQLAGQEKGSGGVGQF
jgi:hypothetical protein